VRPVKLWLLTVGVFAAAMVASFFLSGLARRTRSKTPQLNPDLAVAIETAKRTLPDFIAKLQKPPKDAIAFAVKVSFVESGQAEMMWMDNLTYREGGFDGTLADTPQLLTKLHKGQKVHSTIFDVVDWEIVYRSAEGELHEGGETDRVLRRSQASHTLRYPPPMSPLGTRLA
jgi:uncharacterized protein YegJ (DUF2314 family)